MELSYSSLLTPSLSPRNSLSLSLSHLLIGECLKDVTEILIVLLSPGNVGKGDPING